MERAATTGGGRTYRGQMPVNWYATLVIICVVGLLLIVVSRYQRTHQTASSAGPPTTSQTWFAAVGVDICGKVQPDLPANTNNRQTGLVANGNGVVTVAPKNSSESGGNATLGRFVSNYPGLALNSSTLQYPGQATMTNGDVCPKGTPQAGKPGVVIVTSWPSPTAKGKGTETSGPPQDLKFANGQLITMAFLPPTVEVPKPPGQAVANLLNALASGSATPSTTLPTGAPPTTTSGTSTTQSTVGSGR